MTLKQLRISKGLSQKDCALLLGMTTRNYQYYENNDDKINTAKYNAIYQKLEMYGKISSLSFSDSSYDEFNTHVVLGNGLKHFYKIANMYDKRDCYKYLKKYIYGDYDGKICILYGLRRTGKTTIIFQMLEELSNEKAAYIKIKAIDNMYHLTKDLKKLYEYGYKYVFIDEITLLKDFIDNAAVLSDVFSMLGMKIIVSGTDSLGFVMASRDELYDRNIMIHTSFIPFKEYSRLLNINSIDKYIEYGGLLKKENMNYDDPDAFFDEVSFKDDESTRKYIDSAISRNIQHTLRNDNNGEYFNQLRELYDLGELTNVINRIVESMNHQFLLKVVEEKFKSHDFGSAKNHLMKNPFNPISNVLNEVDYESIIKRLKTIVEIKEKDELMIRLTQEHIDKVKKYLIALDLIINCPTRYESGGYGDYYVFAQPGMRYSIAKALVYSLKQDEYFASISELDKETIINKILEDVKGKMLEDIVLLETSKFISRNEEVFKFKFDMGGEYDMVIYNKITNSCRIYEVKHSNKIDKRQTIHLKDEDKNNIIKNRFGNINGKYVLYRGNNKAVDDIKYINVEEYLKKIF